MRRPPQIVLHRLTGFVTCRLLQLRLTKHNETMHWRYRERYPTFCLVLRNLLW